MNLPATVPRLSRPPVGSIVQAAAALRFLGTNRDGAGVTAIARAIGIGPSSCFNVLRTLVLEDLVAFDPVTKTYTLGLGTIDLARRALRRDAVVQAAEGSMAMLAETYDAAIGLWRLAPSDRLVLVALAESEAATRIHMVVGQRQPAAAGAAGRAVIATRGLDDEAVLAMFEQTRWQNPPTAAQYLAQVRAARSRGFAVDVDQINRGIATIAAAIVDDGGEARFVLSASMFAGRDAATLDRIGQSVHEQAKALSSAVSRA